MNRFASTFDRLRRESKCGLFPWLMAGFPDVPTARALADVALEVGVDGFEVGVPFSDPLADGATMQRANARALEGGATLDTALDLARHIRGRAPDVPIALMSYYNPLRQRGDQQVAADLAAAEVDGLIVADLPPEEASALHAALVAHDIGLVPLLAPTSPSARMQAVASMNPIFIYCVALIGVTGARQDLSQALPEFLSRVADASSAPQVIGFGISRAEHVQRVAELGAAGAIVASALADLVERSEDPIAAVRSYLTELEAATRAGSLAS